MKRGFTLIEIIIVIIIVGILGALGMTQYSNVVERGRITEAKMGIGTMRQLATEYYWEKSTLVGLTSAYVGVDNTCSGERFFSYSVGSVTDTYAYLRAYRCTSGGKTPHGNRGYRILLRWSPGTGQATWSCNWLDDSTACPGWMI